ncbi:uncharacterized protein LOC100202199 isoform X3 [Hydra vulgaris]|uniref:uncharacterized protein LOC100202199 isoform X3 n=1 Tax=Hydra vulgaris TaxID=6087 RepID=UPI0032EA3B5E
MLFQYLVSFSAFICGNCIFPLTVDETLYNQSLKDKEAIQYIVKDLQVGARYEVRVSYPSVIPTDFVIDVGIVEDAFLSRALLNVEQMHFIAQENVYFVKVTAYRTGVPLRLESSKSPLSRLFHRNVENNSVWSYFERTCCHVSSSFHN